MAQQIDTSKKLGPVEQGQIRSFDILYQRLSTAIRQFDTSAIKVLLQQDLCAQLGQGLGYFTRVKNVDTLRTAANDIKDKLAGKVEISQIMRDSLIVPFAESMSLECKVAVQVIEEYFSRNSARLTYFISLETALNEVTKKMQQIQQQNVYYQMQDEQRRHDHYRQEIVNHCLICRSEARQTYFNERQKLLNCLRLFINEAFGERPFQSLFNDFVHSKLIKNQNLPLHMIEGLTRNLDWEKEFRLEEPDNKSPADARETLLSSLQDEQIEQLKILFNLYFRCSVPNSTEVGQMIAYLRSTGFQGSLGKQYRTISESESYQQKQQVIAGLGELTSLCMLQLHKGAPQPIVTPDNKDIWTQVTNTQELNLASSLLYFAIVQTACNANKDLLKQKEVSEFFRSFIDSPAMVKVSDLLELPLIKDEKYRGYQGSFFNVIKSWLNLAFPFYKEQNLLQEMEASQSLSMQLLRNADNLKAIWASYDLKPENLVKQLQMFEPVLKQPVSQIECYLQICLALCGNSRQPCADKVYELMAANGVLEEVLGWLTMNLNKLQNQYSTEDEIQAFSAAVIIFSKVIKQRPDFFRQLNDTYSKVSEGYNRNDLKFSFDQRSTRKFQSTSYVHDIQFNQGSLPFIRLLVEALNCFIFVEFAYSKRTITHIIDALASIYEGDYSLRMPIISELNQNDGEISKIVIFFSNCFLDGESIDGDYRTSESFIRLLCKIFKSSFPQECLNEQERIYLHHSFLSQALELVYLPMLQSYQDRRFKTHASFSRYIARFLKLTRLLLLHMIDIPQTQKAKLSQPTPKYDQLLHVITTTLNHLNIEQTCLSVLELKEVKFGTKTRYENRWVHDTVAKGDGEKSVVKSMKMVQEAFQVINLILRLALVDNDMTLRPEAKLVQDELSTRAYFIQHLHCVKSIRSQVLDPTKASTLVVHQHNETSVNASIFGLFTNYLPRSDYHIVPNLEAQSLQFMTLCCQLWQSQLHESRVPNLMLLLKQDSFSTQLQLQQVFATQMKQSFENETKNGVYKLSPRFLDLLCLLADTQPKFVELVLGSDGIRQSKSMVAEAFVQFIKHKNANQLTDESLQIDKEMTVKLIVLFSLLAQRKVCMELLAFNDFEILAELYRGGVQQCYHLVKKAENEVKFTGDFIQPCCKGDNNELPKRVEREHKGLIAYNGCIAKVGIIYFMRMLAALYQRDPNQKRVRQIIVNLFTSDHWKQSPSATLAQKQQINELTHQANLVNQACSSSEERNIELQQIQFDVLHQNHPQQMSKNEQSLLRSDGALVVNGLLGYELHESLSKTALYCLILGFPKKGPTDKWRSPGSLGSELYVSTRELQYTMNKEFYHNKDFIAQAKAVFMELNLALSTLHTDCELIKAKQEFILQIGKTMQRENQSKEMGDSLLQLSMLPLVTVEAASGNQDHLNKYASQVIRVMEESARTLFTQLTARPSMETDQTSVQYLVLKLHEAQIDSLITALSVIACWLRSSSKIDARLRSELEQLVRQHLLPKVCDLFDFSGCEMAVAIDQRHFNQVMRVNEKTNYELFIQLALQTLLILQAFSDAKQEEPARKKTEDQIIRILGVAVDSMNKEYQFERCLQIYQTAFGLLEEDTTLKVMRRRDHVFLREVFDRMHTLPARGVSAVYQLLINYAQHASGAIHLKEFRVLEALSKSECLIKLIDQDLYITTKVGDLTMTGSQQIQVRNPLHIQWCQVLVLLRTLNTQLLEDDEHIDYLMQLIQLLRSFGDRFSRVLHTGVHLARQIDINHNQVLVDDKRQQLLSLALLEETELVMDVLSQMFEHAQIWYEKDLVGFSAMKDYVLFAVPKLLSFAETRSMQPISDLEIHLSQVTTNDKQAFRLSDRPIASEQDFTAFSIKAEACLVKISLTCSYSLLSILLNCSGPRRDLIQTWFTQRSSSSPVINTAILSPEQSFHLMKFAYEAVYLSQERMLDRAFTLQTNVQNGVLFSHMTRLMHNDQWVQREYAGGLGHYLSASIADLEEPMNQVATGLQISSQVNCMLLAQVERSLSQNENRYSYYKPVEEVSDVVRKSKELQELLARTERQVSAKMVDKEFFVSLKASASTTERIAMRY